MVDAEMRPAVLRTKRLVQLTLAPVVVAGGVYGGPPHNEYIQARQVSQAFLLLLSRSVVSDSL